MADYIYSMETRLTPDQQNGVNLVQEIARSTGLNLYLTGGTIRDLVTGFPIRDIDLTIQGDPLKLRKELEKAGISIEGVEEELKTLYLLMPGNVRAELNMTRSETYDKPGVSPVIKEATINEDLRRRDFTVNAMALSLNPGSRGLLLDPFNGTADIEAKVLRILHNYAFLEEPSRLIRITRFAARFHWPLEERTQARYDAAKENEYIQFINKRAIGYELEQLSHEDDPLHIMRHLEKEGWLQVLHPNWSVAKAEASDLGQVTKMRQTMNELGYSVETGPIVMYYLTRKMSEKDITDIQNMLPRKDFVEKWKHLESAAQELAKKLTGKEAGTVSGSWKILSSATPESVLFLSLTTKNQVVDQKLKNFFTKWRQVKEKLPFPEMAELLITPQLPEYPKLMEDAFLQLLDGKLRTHTEIVNFLKPYAPPPPPPPAPRRGRGAKAAAEGGSGKRGRKPKAAAVAVSTEPATVAATPAARDEKPAEANGASPKVAASPKDGTSKKPPAKSTRTPEKIKVTPVKAAPAKASASVKSASPHKAVKAATAPAKSSPKKAAPAKAQKKAAVAGKKAAAPAKASAKKAVPAKKLPKKK